MAFREEISFCGVSTVLVQGHKDRPGPADLLIQQIEQQSGAQLPSGDPKQGNVQILFFYQRVVLPTEVIYLYRTGYYSVSLLLIRGQKIKCLFSCWLCNKYVDCGGVNTNQLILENFILWREWNFFFQFFFRRIINDMLPK